jgi:HNH endonuclease/AP2 domain
MADQIISQEYLREIFDYKDGELYYKKKYARNIKIGKKVGRINPYGYVYTRINGKEYRNHRLIFMMFNGYFPEQVDHIDGNPTNNRIENLRAANNTKNQWNSKVRKDSKSGIKGIRWYSNYKKWVADCKVNGKRHHIGYFENLEEAKEKLQQFRQQNHGEFANNG